jgi:hypothetical protein
MSLHLMVWIVFRELDLAYNRIKAVLPGTFQNLLELKEINMGQVSGSSDNPFSNLLVSLYSR